MGADASASRDLSAPQTHHPRTHRERDTIDPRALASVMRTSVGKRQAGLVKTL